MSIQASSYITLNPSFMEPELIIQYSQASGFLDTLAGEEMRVRIAEDDLLIYQRTVNFRSKVAAGQSWGEQELPGVDIMASMISTPTYGIKTRAQYDHHDVAAAARWGIAAPEAYRLGLRQANFQFARDAVLHGISPDNGEGLLNAQGATSENLPPDSNGATTVRTYDNGEMAFFLATTILDIKTRTRQLGMGRKFTIIGPQRTLGRFEYNVVQLTQFQREGAGTASTKETMEKIVQGNGDTVLWSYDDTLENALGDGIDAVIIVMPEVEKPSTEGMSTNAFAGLMPGSNVCVTAYCDMAAPREIISPLAAGATDMVTEWRISSGWAPRSTAITIVAMPF